MKHISILFFLVFSGTAFSDTNTTGKIDFFIYEHSGEPYFNIINDLEKNEIIELHRASMTPMLLNTCDVKNTDTDVPYNDQFLMPHYSPAWHFDEGPHQVKLYSGESFGFRVKLTALTILRDLDEGNYTVQCSIHGEGFNVSKLIDGKVTKETKVYF